MMTEAARVLPKLLLIFLFQTGSHRKDFLVCADSRDDIKYSCGADIVCYHLWDFDTTKRGSFIGIISNGERGMSESLGDDSKCNMPFNDLSLKNAGRHHCQKESGDFINYNNAPVLKLTPGKPVTLQCYFSKYMKIKSCLYYYQQVNLTWVDENGSKIEEDSQHQIQHQSPCAVTLHVALQSPQNRTVRCQLTVGNTVQTSVPLLVQLPEHNHHDVMIGAVVGVVGCVVLTSMVAAFVVNKRRAKNDIQPSDESLNAVNPNNEADTNDVIYTDIVFPVGSSREWVKEREDTEYSTVRY